MIGRPRSVQAARLRYALTIGAATGSLVLGLGLLARPALNDLAGQWDQHRLAVRHDLGTPRYAPAIASAYSVVVEDFEASIVAFETGALPTTVDGRVIGLSGLPRDSAPPEAASSLVHETESDDAPTVVPPGTVAGVAIQIPAIGLSQAVVEGVDREMLKQGPGHYPGTAYPGFTGNVVISGHRTTFTRPFHDLDLLSPGDRIEISTPLGLVEYAVRQSYIVDPTDLGPLVGSEEPVLTLTTCNPKGSARERLIVVADLVGPPLDASER